jgi:hypothetical protein
VTRAGGAALVVTALVTVALVGLFLIPTRSRDPNAPPAVPPSLDATTEVTLVLGGDLLTEFDVDDAVMRAVARRGLPVGAIDELVAVGDHVFIRSLGRAAVIGPRGPARDLGAAIDILVAHDTVALVTYPEPATVSVQTLDERGGVLDEPMTLARRAQVRALLGPHSVLLETVGSTGARTLERWARGDQPRAIARDRIFVAASTRFLVTRERGCRVPPCELVVTRLADGTERRLRAGPASPSVAIIAPSGSNLALLGGDAAALVDLDDLAVTPVAVDLDTGPGAWTADGSWLFVLQDGGAIDAISRSGERFRVGGPVVRADAIAAMGAG